MPPSPLSQLFARWLVATTQMNRPPAQGTQMQVDILLVEDDAEDNTLTLFALLRHQLTNKFYVARDGQEALDYVFCTGQHANRKITDQPRLILLDLFVTGRM